MTTAVFTSVKIISHFGHWISEFKDETSNNSCIMRFMAPFPPSSEKENIVFEKSWLLRIQNSETVLFFFIN